MPGCAGSQLSAVILQTPQAVVASENEPRLASLRHEAELAEHGGQCTARRAVLPCIAGPLSPSSWLAAHLGHCWFSADGTLVPVTLLVILQGGQACEYQGVGDLSYTAYETLRAASCSHSSHTSQGN